MPTKNPKISAYVPQEVFDRFQEFQEDRGFSMSKAVIAILCDYFDIKETTSNLLSGITLAQFQALEKRLSELEEKVEHQPIYQGATLMSTEPKSLESKSDIASLPSFLDSEPLRITSNSLSEFTVLTATELADRFDFKTHQSVTNARNRLKTTEKFVEWSTEKDPDGLGWTYRLREDKSFEYFPVQHS